MKDRKGEHPFGDEGQFIALGVFMVMWIVDSFFLHLSTFLTGDISIYLRLIIAAGIMLIAALLINAGHFVVRNGERPDYVVSSGAFHYIRHPMYLGSLLFYLALTVSTLSLVSFGLGLVIFVFYNYLAAYEEKLLENKFGQAYLDYKRQTGRWLPRLFPDNEIVVIRNHREESQK